MRSTTYHQRLHQLDAFLFEHQTLWQPEPFKIARPAWCQTYPELTQALLQLDETAHSHLSVNHAALLALISDHIPAVAAIHTLTQLSETVKKPENSMDVRLHAGIPGRKWQQIHALYRSITNPQRTITEWCGGKGYLGRLLSSQWQQPVITLEQNPSLTQAGQALADTLHLPQQFKQLDVLHDAVHPYLANHHTIALHACGDLHRTLVHHIIAHDVPSFTLIPCCYHLGRDENYTPFTHGLKLQLSRASLRLAVNETVTAHAGEIEKRNRDMAWKLGFQLLRQSLDENSHYQPFKPVPKAWLNGNFESYVQQLCQREGLMRPDDFNGSAWEIQGRQRRDEVIRLQLLRQCFKRVLELWLIMDMAAHLEVHGYHINITLFCDRKLTPRNIMIEGWR